MFKKLSCLALFALLCMAAGAQAAEFSWTRAAYYDSRYATGWTGDADAQAVRDGLKAAGYEILNADQLKTWMQARISDKKYSVVVFCKDIAPDTVIETNTTGCTLRKYLDAGGKIVFYADIPFYNQAHADGTLTNWAEAGPANILSIGNVSVWDTNNTVKITPAGVRWGLTQTWASVRPYAASNANFTILATDNAGNAAAWVKSFAKNDKFRGFVRLWDRGGRPPLEDIIRAAEYVDLKATVVTPLDGATGVTMGLLQWTPSSFAIYHELYLGTSPTLTAANKMGRLMQMQTMFFTAIESGQTYYWRVDEVESDGSIRTGDVWSFTTAPVTAFAPMPRNGDKWIDPNVDLSWSAGQGAMQHTLYFGTDQAAVAARDAGVSKGTQYTTSFDVGLLTAETTYYWAVDETGSGDYAGPVWSFTTVGDGGGGVKAEYFNNMTVTGAPDLTLIESSIDHSWGDPGGPGTPIGTDGFSARWTADLEIAVADTYTFITTSDDGARLWLNDERIIDRWVDQGTTDVFSAGLALEPGIYSLRMEYYENTGGAVAQLSWQTPTVARTIIPPGPLQPPVRAKAIYPKDGDANVPQDLTLMWLAGERAVTHDVYLGTDEAAVAAATTGDAAYQGNQSLEETTFTPGNLQWNTTYYWRIDEVNSASDESPWKGAVWSFTTADFIVVDDFEVYGDNDTGRIFQTWIDGWGYTTPEPGNPGNGTGGTVGYIDPPFAEKTIVRGGLQSMPFDYNNLVSPYYSETERTFETAKNWKVNGVKDLSLQFRGYPARFVDDGTRITISSRSADVWGTADAFRYVYKRLNGDGSMTAKVLSMSNAADWSKGGVMVRESLSADSAHGFMVVTPSGRRALQNRPTTAGSSFSAHSATGVVTLPFWVRIERKGTQVTGYYSVDGKTWVTQPSTENTGTDASPNPQTIAMGSSIYIGLAVTSNNTAASCVMEFSDVTTTGPVTGQWQMVEIGGDNPGNDPDTFYVALQDSAGKLAVVNNPNANATTVATWTEWKVPLSQFTGVNLGAIKKVYIGVGDRKAPKLGGAGMLYIDDIRVVR